MYRRWMSRGKFGKGCQHLVVIPLLQLQSSANDATCLICHVFFAAVEPFLVSVNQDLLANFAVMVREGERQIYVVSRKDGEKIENSIVLDLSMQYPFPYVAQAAMKLYAGTGE
jgi:hypothetical protein